MKKKGWLTLIALLAAPGASTALAAASGRQDNSSLVVWLFLGFCALIVVAQLLPLILQLRVFARQHREAADESLEAEPVQVTTEK